MNKTQLKRFIKENQSDLKNKSDAMITERLINILTNKGFNFDSEHDMHMFFKNRVKSRIDNGKTTIMVDGMEILVYSNPIYAPLKNSEVSIGIEFMEL